MILEEDYGIRPADVTWVRGGYEQPGRVEKINLNLPADVVVENAGPDDTISGLLSSGRLDAVIGRGPHPVSSKAIRCWLSVCRPAADGSGLVPADRAFSHHAYAGIRRTLRKSIPWLPVAVFKAFERSKTIALSKLGDTSAAKVTLPFVEEQLRVARLLMGEISGLMDSSRTAAC